MIQSIYTSVSDANLVSCGKKGQHITSEPIPLLRDKFLGEYRTELERAKVRRNLGILDDQVIEWKNIKGFIEDNPDLTNFVNYYSNPDFENLTTVRDALDYALQFVTTFETDTESIKQLKQDVIEIREDISQLESTLTEDIQANAESIITIQQNIQTINNSISDLNDQIQNINVDENISNWIQDKLKKSKTIQITGIDQDTLEVILSEEEDNAITLKSQVLEPTEESIEPITQITPGLYVKNLEPKVESIQTTVDTHTQNILEINTELDVADTYQTMLSSDTKSVDKVGGIESGTSVETLKGKTITEILDQILFPTFVRELIQPQAYYTISDSLVEVGSMSLNPQLEFIQGDAGLERERNEVISFNDVPEEAPVTQYTKLGKYKYTGTINYYAGEYLIDNKGQTTDKRIEEGSVSSEITISTTYPWFAGNVERIEKQSLVAFDEATEQEISLTGQAVIKLPGKNTKLTSFQVNGGLGFLDVDLRGWTETTDTIGGFTYKIWTKLDAYPSLLPHKLNFILSE